MSRVVVLWPSEEQPDKALSLSSIIEEWQGNELLNIAPRGI